ncbi:MAG: lysophospholipid acyltransferase family protein [Campylobacterales bacterium]
MLSKEKKRVLISKVVPPIAYLLIRLLAFTNRKIFHIKKIPKESFIIAFWHGELLMQPLLYRKMKKPKISVMISEHFDGEIIAKTIGYFGFETLRGSSSKGATRLLIQSIKKLKCGYEVAITPDGPRGPRHSVADGIIALAQKTKKPIVVFRSRPTKSWRLKSWDRFEIPKPFGTIEFFAQEPFFVHDMEFEEAREYIKKRMLSYE